MESTVQKSSYARPFVPRVGLVMEFAIPIAIYQSVRATKETAKMCACALVLGLGTGRVIRSAIKQYASTMEVIVLKKNAALDADQICWQTAFVITSATRNLAVWIKETAVKSQTLTVLVANNFRETECVTKSVTLPPVFTTMETASNRQREVTARRHVRHQ